MGNERVADATPASVDTLVADLTEAVTAPAETPSDTPASTPETSDQPDWIEDKFWTGDVAESAAKQHDAYVSLQSSYGRMANDLGTQRKLTDRLLDLKREDDLTQNTPAQTPEIDGVKLLDNPNETLDAYVSPKIAESNKEINERLAKMEAEIAQDNFVKKHPEAGTMGNDPDFVKWVNGSPYRASLGNAASQGDFLAADELLTEWKDRLAAVTPAAKEDAEEGEDPNLAAARAASLESNSGGKTASGKVYERNALIKLKLEKPHVYEDPKFQAEIMRAYAEGRVK